MAIPRRGLFLMPALILACSVCAVTHSALAQYARPGGTKIVSTQAVRLLADRKILLVDIRLPQEWRQTGVAVGAVPITMHQNFDRFVQALRAKLASANGRQLALICARGVRSRRMQRVLAKIGMTNVVDVTDGMLGSPAGPGWRKSGLAIRRWP
ncbi:MAG: rhodanese-like domain-containing protein [Pseudomonadota bacterium]